MKRKRNAKWFVLPFTLVLMFIVDYFINPSSESSQGRWIFNRHLLDSELFNGCSEIKFNCEVTAYCPGPCCNLGIIYKNGERFHVDWSDKVAAGNFSIKKLHKYGVNLVAVDPAVIPHDSIIYYNGKYYLALDSGAAIKGKKIDILMENHNDTIAFGRKKNQQAIVLIPENPDKVIKYLRIKHGKTD